MLVSALDLYLKILCTGRDVGWLSARPLKAGGDASALALAGFQAGGAQAVLVALERFGGALLCDSPGLGKTRVALAVAAACAGRGAPPLFVLPAALVPVWRPLVESCGLPFRPLTHQALGHPSREPACDGQARLVVVDEAHAFRNPATRSYRRLARLCSGRRVLLVTATPVNNHTEDLYHLLKLFAGEGAFAGLGVPSLRAAFRSSPSRDGAAWPDGANSALHDALRVLEAVMVRRTRGDVAVPATGSPTREIGVLSPELPEGLRFPERRLRELAPVPSQGDGARFDALLAGLRRQARALPLLVSVLAKRLASSPVALARTLDRLCAWSRLRASRPSAGWTTAMRRRLLETVDEEGGLQHLLPFGPGPAPPTHDGLRGPPVGLADALPPGWLEAMRAEARALARVADERALALERLLGSELADVKTVVFSEYRDTALCLFRSLTGVPRRAFLDGRGGLTASGPCSRAELLRRFAPATHGGVDRGELPWHEQVQVLFATDVLSEGLNLQEAAAVVSFDLPWNPVRLIQRAGRIDRLGSPHALVQIFHVRPRPELDRLLRLTGRLLRKSRAIRSTLGQAGEDRTLESERDLGGRDGIEPGAGSAAPGHSPPVTAAAGPPDEWSKPGLGHQAGVLDSASRPRAALAAELDRFERLAPKALARAGRLPDGLLAPAPLPCSAESPAVLACYLLDWPGAPGAMLEWFRLEGGWVRPAGLSEDCLVALRAGLAAGPFARLASGVPEGWLEFLEAAVSRRLRRLTSRSAAKGAPLTPPLRRLLARVQHAQRQCRCRPELLRRYEALERLLASPLEAGLEERLLAAARSRPGAAELPALAEELVALAAGRTGAQQESRKVVPVRFLGAFLLG